MKTQVSIFFLLILFLPSVGTTLWFLHRQKEIRKEVKHRMIAGLEDSQLTHFTFTLEEMNSLDWKHEKEFRWEGVMYDIVKRSKERDRYHFWCWKDDKETNLYQQYESLLAKLNMPDPEDQQNSFKWWQFQNTLFCYAYETWEPKPILSFSKNSQIPYYNLYQSIRLDSSSPPPLTS